MNILGRRRPLTFGTVLGPLSGVKADSLVRQALKRASRVSLTKRFAFVSFVILLTGMLVIGWWVANEIETGVMNRTASVTASFVTSSVAPDLQNLGETGDISPEQIEDLDRILFQTELGERIVSFKVWSPDGQILYSPDENLVGGHFEVGFELQKALRGETVSHITDLSNPENEYERQRFSRLVETYTPLRSFGTGEIIGAVEFYEGTEALLAEIQAARNRSWLVVGAATLAMYLILVGMVKGASLTIGRQRQQLEQRIGELDTAVSQNRDLNRQLTAVAAVATAANEVRDQEGMLRRCLDVVLEYTRMERVSVRLVDGKRNRLEVACARGDFSGFPCRDEPVGLNECPCGQVASGGASLYLGPGEERYSGPPCPVSQARVLAIHPLKSPKGVLGVLSLIRSHGRPPTPEERETLDAICNQVAVAIENNRLLGELGQVEAERELSRMKAEFISALSHELRTPLGFIKGYSTTLLRDDIAVDANSRQEFLGVIDEESSKLQVMIDDLLDASRIQANRFEMDRRRLDLRELLENAIYKATPGIEQSGRILETALPDESIEIQADSVRIEQVLHNLLDNAARYSAPGSKIEVKAVLRDLQAVVSVKDQGDGVPTGELERIFEAFYRTEDTRRQGIRGTGLGLAICRGIIEAHGGKLWAESTLRKGSTFFFSLPLSVPLEADADSPGAGHGGNA